MICWWIGPFSIVFLVSIVSAGEARPGPGGPDKKPKETSSASKGTGKDPTCRQLQEWLDEPFDTKEYQNPLTLRTFLTKLTKEFAARGKPLAVVIDENAFREENPDAPDVYDAQVLFPPLPRRM